MLLTHWTHIFWTALTLTRTVARNRILTQFRDGWLADPASAGIPVFYADQTRNRPTDDKEAFVRASVNHLSGEQTTLANDAGKVTFSRDGLFIAQIFTVSGEGLTNADILAKVVTDTFEGKNNLDIWYRNVRVNELGRDGDRFLTNVLVDFTYDEIK